MDSKPGNATPNGTCRNVSIGGLPQLAAERLGTDAPSQLTLIGDPALLLVSGFDASVRRVTQVLAWRRNLLVAALADEVFFAHIAPGGNLERLAQRVRDWRV